MVPNARELTALAAAATALIGLYNIGYRRGWTNCESSMLGSDAKDVKRTSMHGAESDEEVLKAELLDHLAQRSYVKLAPSTIAGVGVFAVVQIPAGVDPFCIPNAHLRAPERPVQLQFVDLLRHCPPEVIDHVLEFHDAIDHSGSGEELTSEYLGNATGMASMDTSWYLNHSENANVIALAAERDGFTTYRTSRAVSPGEELVLDYRICLPSVYAKMERERAYNDSMQS